MKRVFTKLASAALAAVMTMSCAPAADFGGFAPLAVEVQAANAYVGITESSGWLEGAWVEWKPTSTSNLSYYKVKYSGTASGTVDDKLVRRYKDGHWRADLVGLKAGSYTITVEGYNKSNSLLGSETASVTVTGHDRTGFTFSPKSRYDTSDTKACGGYNGDGTPKTGANILYITSAADIDSVTYEGYTGLSTILQNRHKQSSAPLIIRLVGKIEYSGAQLNGSGYVQVKPSQEYANINTTIEGVGSDTTINFGFLLRNAGNVEIRNLAIHDFADDGISLDTANSDIWIHNCEFFYGVQGSGDKAKGDGSSDVKNDSQYVTLSYNHYWDAGKCSLCGMKSETGDNYITYHHNWFDHSDSRHPRIRTMFVHVYNNYYDGNAKYGIGASENSNAFVEGNYFRNCKYPTLQGSVGCDADGTGGSATLDDSNPIGAIKMWNNTVVGANSKWTTSSSGDTSSNADACVATSRNQSVTYTTAKGASYRNYDVSDSYIQSLASVVQQPEAAKTTVEKYAGRTGGGDFAKASGFAFTAADDTLYDINSSLRTALTNYYKNSVSSQFAIQSVGGSFDGTAEVPTEATTKAPETESTTKEAATESTTKEAATESTTQAPTPSGSVEVKPDANGGYKFSTAAAGTLTLDTTYGGAYASLDTNENNVKISGGKAVLTDTSTTYATSLKMPMGKTYTSGTLVIKGTVIPHAAASKWAYIDIQGANGSVLKIGTDGSKMNSIATTTVSGSTTTNNYVSGKVAAAANSEIAYEATLDLTNKTATVKLGSETLTTTLLGTNVNQIVSTTSVGSARNLTVGDIEVTYTSGGTTPTVVKGDADGDGDVDNADVAKVIAYAVGKEASVSSNADVNGDGKVDVADAYKISQKVLGIISNL